MSPHPDEAARNLLDVCAPGLERLADHWPRSVRTHLYFDTARGVIVGPDPAETLKSLYGGVGPRLLRNFKQHLSILRHGRRSRRSIRLTEHSLPLPADAVLVPRPMNRGMVVISASSRLVLKLYHGERPARQLENEAGAYLAVDRSSILPPMPRLIAIGCCEPGANWLFQEFAPNTRPVVLGRLLRCTEWPNIIEHVVSPRLFPFYRVAGTTVISGRQWIERLRERAAASPNAEMLGVILSRAEDAIPEGTDPGVVLSRVHGDLSPEHLHRSETTWYLVDWGHSDVAPIMIDWCADLLMLRPSWFCRRTEDTIASWIAGRFVRPDRHLRRILGGFYDCQQNHLGLEVPSRFWRYQVLAAIVELHCLRLETLGFPPDQLLERVVPWGARSQS